MELKTCKFERGLGTPNKRKVYIFPLLAKDVRTPVEQALFGNDITDEGDNDYDKITETDYSKWH